MDFGSKVLNSSIYCFFIRKKRFVVDSVLLEEKRRIAKFLKAKFKIFPFVPARTKLKKMVLPLLLALKLKAMIVLPIVITLIGLIGIKGLGAGLLSLLLSGAVALKALLTPPPPPARVTYGVVKPEIHHEHWHRSQEELNQPYRGWAPEFGPEQYPYQDIP